MHRRALLAGALVGFGGFSECSDGNAEEDDFSCTEGDADKPIDIEAFPGMDTPPHSIEEQDRERDDWNNHYLGECMDEDPTVPFEFETSIELDGRWELDDTASHAVRWVRTGFEAAQWFPRSSRFLDIDYDQASVIVVRTWHHSSDRTHHWVRVEETSAGLHAHGYQWDARYPQADSGGTASGVLVEYDGTADERVTVSLTSETDERFHCTTENGPVNLEGFDFPDD